MRRRGAAEPSIPWSVKVAMALFGAKRVLTPPLRRRLLLTGLTWEETAPVLAQIRGIEASARIWERAARVSAEHHDWRRATAQAFLAQLPLSPYHPRKAELLDLLREYHSAHRRTLPQIRFERVALLDGALRGYWERPLRPTRPPVLILPPLASTKEEMGLLADPLLAAGHPVLRLELPGQGESRPPLTIDAERTLARAVDEMGWNAETGYFCGGISLGAYFALRLAGYDRERVRGAWGVSPPAIITPAQWRRQKEIIWQYLDIYFATSSREETRRLGLSMILDGVMESVACPVMLFHAARDPISLPDKAERYRSALENAALIDFVLDETHGCALSLQDPIAPRLVAWSAAIGRTASAESLAKEFAVATPKRIKPTR